MENILLNVLLAVAGIFFARAMLGSVLKNKQKKKEFMHDYFSVLNNPEFKVKRSYE